MIAKSRAYAASLDLAIALALIFFTSQQGQQEQQPEQ